MTETPSICDLTTALVAYLGDLRNAVLAPGRKRPHTTEIDHALQDLERAAEAVAKLRGDIETERAKTGAWGS